MITVGEQLQRAREHAGLTLQQIAEQTKIQQWILAAIERGDMSRVPGGVFTRGYLTSFARAVGLDAQGIWSDYLAETAAPATAPPDEPDGVPQPAGFPWSLIAVVAIVLIVVVAWLNMPRMNPDTPRVASPVHRDRVSEVVPAAAATAGTAVEAVAAVDSTDASALARSPAPIVVEVHANADVWLEATVDGERRAYRTFIAGENLHLDARSQIALRVGDASAVTYTINGASGRPLGGAGVVRELMISPDTYHSLVAPDARTPQ